MAKQKKGASKTFRLDVSYPLARAFDLDRVITEAVGRASGSSGAGFGERDMNFYFASQRAMDAAARRLTAAKIAEVNWSTTWFWEEA